MAQNRKLLKQARELQRERRAQADALFYNRQEALYAKIPRLKEIDLALRETIRDTIRTIAFEAGAKPESHLDSIGQRNQALQEEARGLLVKAGFPPDYLDPAPLCALCNDTGHQGTALCGCLKDIYQSLQAQELSSLLNLGQENFDAFSLEYYDSRTIDPRFGTTARENMEMNFKICRKYADSFGPDSKNLFLLGDAGLGKTFLSSCIAKVVSEAGFSVVYDTSASLFSRFEEEKFGRYEDPEAAQLETQRYLGCDLLILDDLGTEMVTSFVVSALYNLLNTRLLQKKQTVISSNFSLEALRDKYSPQIMSRLEGEYEVLTFFGKDIRKLKKEM